MQSQIKEFKDRFKAYHDAIQYIEKNFEGLKQDAIRFDKVQKNLRVKFEEPLDLAWKALTLEEQNCYGTLYRLRRLADDEGMKELIAMANMFHGKILHLEKIN